MMNTCLQCKNQYEAKTGRSIYCSNVCRNKSFRSVANSVANRVPLQSTVANEQSTVANATERDENATERTVTDATESTVAVANATEGKCRSCNKEVNPLIYLCRECFDEGKNLPSDTPKEFPAYCTSHGEHVREYCESICNCVHA